MNSAQELGVDRQQALEAELTALEAELAQYQKIIDDIPLIYEDKFRQQLQALILEISNLLEERTALRCQISGQVSSRAAVHVLRAPSSQRAPWWKRSHHCQQLVVRKFLALRPRDYTYWFLLPALAILLGLLATRLMVQQRSVHVGPPEKASSKLIDSSRLHLRASGESWLEVRDFNDALIFTATLQAGEGRSLPLVNGLKIRSGRPDLLMVAIGDASYQVMGSIEEVGWRVYRPLGK